MRRGRTLAPRSRASFTRPFPSEIYSLFVGKINITLVNFDITTVSFDFCSSLFTHKPPTLLLRALFVWNVHVVCWENQYNPSEFWYNHCEFWFSSAFLRIGPQHCSCAPFSSEMYSLFVGEINITLVNFYITTVSFRKSFFKKDVTQNFIYLLHHKLSFRLNY